MHAAANAYFRKPLNPELPSPADVAALRLPPGEQLLIAKTDLAHCYHSLVVPEWLTDYFGLPAVTAGELGLVDLPPDAVVFPRCTRLAMGFSHAVRLAQRGNRRLVADSGVPDADLVLPGGTDHRLQRPRVIVYLDDVVWLGLSRHREQLLSMQGKYVVRGQQRGWTFAPKKLLLPSLQGEVLGLTVDGIAGTYALARSKTQQLVLVIDALLSMPQVDVRALQSVLGKCVWSMLPFRPALSAFHNIFRWISTQERLGVPRADLGPAVRRELRIAAGILPLAVADLRAVFFQHAIATDASEHGFGVVAATPEPDLLASAAVYFGAASVPAGQQVDSPRDAARDAEYYRLPPALRDLLLERYRTIVSSPVRLPAHISALECTAATLGLRWALTTPAAIGARILLLVDNTPVCCALAKGRSSSPILHQNVSRHAAFCLAAGARTVPVWVPTLLNPADAASRLR